MKPRVFAVIHERSINNHTGFRRLVGENIFEVMNFDLIIEITIDEKGYYIPVKDEVRAEFPTISRAFVVRIILQY